MNVELPPVVLDGAAMEPDHSDIKHLRDTIAALKEQLAACAEIHDDRERERMIKFIQTEIAYAERVIQLKLDDD